MSPVLIRIRDQPLIIGQIDYAAHFFAHYSVHNQQSVLGHSLESIDPVIRKVPPGAMNIEPRRKGSAKHFFDSLFAVHEPKQATPGRCRIIRVPSGQYGYSYRLLEVAYAIKKADDTCGKVDT